MFTFKTSDTSHYIILSKVCSFTINEERPCFHVDLTNGRVMKVPMKYAKDFLKVMENRYQELG